LTALMLSQYQSGKLHPCCCSHVNALHKQSSKTFFHLISSIHSFYI
jgi:hypothetical protein